MSSFDLGKSANPRAPSANNEGTALPPSLLAFRERQQQGVRMLRRLGLFALVAGCATFVGVLGVGNAQELSAAGEQGAELWSQAQRWFFEASAGSSDNAAVAVSCTAPGPHADYSAGVAELLTGPVPKLLAGATAFVTLALSLVRGNPSTAVVGLAVAVACTMPQLVLTTLGC